MSNQFVKDSQLEEALVFNANDYVTIVAGGQNFKVKGTALLEFLAGNFETVPEPFFNIIPDYSVDAENSEVNITTNGEVNKNGQSITTPLANIAFTPVTAPDQRFDAVAFDLVSNAWVILSGNESENPQTPLVDKRFYLLLAFILVSDGEITEEPIVADHEQNKDQYLDQGGAYEVSAKALKELLSRQSPGTRPGFLGSVYGVITNTGSNAFTNTDSLGDTVRVYQNLEATLARDVGSRTIIANEKYLYVGANLSLPIYNPVTDTNPGNQTLGAGNIIEYRQGPNNQGWVIYTPQLGDLALLSQAEPNMHFLRYSAGWHYLYTFLFPRQGMEPSVKGFVTDTGTNPMTDTKDSYQVLNIYSDPAATVAASPASRTIAHQDRFIYMGADLPMTLYNRYTDEDISGTLEAGDIIEFLQGERNRGWAVTKPYTRVRVFIEYGPNGQRDYSWNGLTYELEETGGGTSPGGAVDAGTVFYVNSDLDTVSNFMLYKGPRTAGTLSIPSELSAATFEVSLDATVSWVAQANVSALQTWIDTNVTTDSTLWRLRVIATYGSGKSGEVPVVLSFV